MCTGRRGVALLGVMGCVVGLVLAGLAWPQDAKSRGQRAVPDLPHAPNLTTPRETLKTLYFSVAGYDFRSSLINDAVACLESPVDGPREFSEASRLAIQLDGILRELCFPVLAVPDKMGAGHTCVLHDADGICIVVRRQQDGLWRFDHDTVERIPEMYRIARARHYSPKVEANMRDGYTNPSATMRRFTTDSFQGDFYAAAQALDLRRLPVDQQAERGPILAQQLMFVIQRRGYIFNQEIPNNPDGPSYTLHADTTGRIALDRVRLPDGKEAWLFGRNTVKNIEKMYEAAQKSKPDQRYAILGRDVPPVPPQAAAGIHRPESVPPHLGSPRAVLKGFFRAMDAAQDDENRLSAAADYLDLQAFPAGERPVVGGKLAAKLEAVLRKINLDLAAIPDSWNASPQILGAAQELRVELLRQRDGTWRFSKNTVEQVPQLFEKLGAQERAARERVGHMESARDTMVTFLSATKSGDDDLAARCLDLSGVHPSARAEAGPALAFKLLFVLDRIGRVYAQEIPDDPEGPRYVCSASGLGRIVIARQSDGPDKGKWLFTAETVERIEPMFLASLDRPVDPALVEDGMLREATLQETPGVWVRVHMPPVLRTRAGGLELYQWLGLGLTVVASWAVAWVWLIVVNLVVVWTLRRSGSALTAPFVAHKLRPLTWVCACWLFFKLPAWLDLPLDWLDTIMPAKTFLMAGLVGWLGFQMVDLILAVYTNSELLRPHRSLSDMIVPVCLRLVKGAVFLLVATYVIYQIGQGESLSRFLTGLGVAGLAASLAAQDILKSFFGTLLLIGERSFKLGDRIKVNGQEGTVENVGFRSTRLRTADGSLVTIPNSAIASASIDNQGNTVVRRFTAALPLSKDVPVDYVATMRTRLEGWLREHAAVDPSDVEVKICLRPTAGVELQVDVALRPSADHAAPQEMSYAILRMVQALERFAMDSQGKAGLRVAS